MGIQKEREAFEQHLTDTGLVEFAGYGFAVDECDEYLHEPTQVAWDSWLIGLNRTKAQAVPEGFVLMPKEPTDEIIEAMNEFDYRNDYSDMDGAYRTIVETLEKAQEDAEREQKG